MSGCGPVPDVTYGGRFAGVVLLCYHLHAGLSFQLLAVTPTPPILPPVSFSRYDRQLPFPGSACASDATADSCAVKQSKGRIFTVISPGLVEPEQRATSLLFPRGDRQGKRVEVAPEPSPRRPEGLRL